MVREYFDIEGKAEKIGKEKYPELEYHYYMEGSSPFKYLVVWYPGGQPYKFKLKPGAKKPYMPGPFQQEEDLPNDLYEILNLAEEDSDEDEDDDFPSQEELEDHYLDPEVPVDAPDWE